MVARLGGDEFGLIFEAAEASAIDAVCRKALDSCAANFSVHGCEIDLTSSAGYVHSGDHRSRDAVDLVRYADIALYAAKHKGRNRACRFDTEMDESALFENAKLAATKLQTLRGLGFRIALDDFGTGYSTMFNIKNFAIDCIRIDKRFIDDLGIHSQSPAIVGSITHLARTLGLTVVAEGVETDIQCQALQVSGCSHLQGLLFGRLRRLIRK